jgi:hypothetical protein
MIEYHGNRCKLICNEYGEYIWFDSNRECRDFIHNNDEGWIFENMIMKGWKTGVPIVVTEEVDYV